MPLATPARLATSSSRAAANPEAENSSSAADRIASRRADQGEPVAQITADWGPMHSAEKRAEMAAWTRKQSYCQQG